MKTRNRIWLCTLLALGLTIIHINSCKKADESQIAVTDNDRNTYKSVTIGKQVWMVENLKTTKYLDGAPIERFGKNRYNGSYPSYGWYGDDSINNNIYGALYTWYAVETGILCPTGWHVPSDAEWIELINYLGGDSLARGKLKETGTIHWLIPDNDADNSSGFTALPAGYHTGWYPVMWFQNNNGVMERMWREESGKYVGLGKTGAWWSSTKSGTENAVGFEISPLTVKVYKVNTPFRYSLSVRCIKDIN